MVLSKFLIKIERMWRREIKEQIAQLTLLYCGRTIRSKHQRYSIKKRVLKILQYPQEKPVLETFFNCFLNFIKKRPQHRCFPVILAKFLRLSILKNSCKQLLFDCFNGSLLHGPKVSMSRLYDNVKSHGLSHRSRFSVFKSAFLCVRKPKMNTFDESIKL